MQVRCFFDAMMSPMPAEMSQVSVPTFCPFDLPILMDSMRRHARDWRGDGRDDREGGQERSEACAFLAPSIMW